MYTAILTDTQVKLFDDFIAAHKEDFEQFRQTNDAYEVVGKSLSVQTYMFTTVRWIEFEQFCESRGVDAESEHDNLRDVINSNEL